MFSRRKVAAASPQEPWGRSRLLLMLAAAATTVTALLLGLGLAIRAAWGNDVAATVPSSITTDAPQVSVRIGSPTNLWHRCPHRQPSPQMQPPNQRQPSPCRQQPSIWGRPMCQPVFLAHRLGRSVN